MATILIIDDNLDLGAILRAHLLAAGHTPVSVGSARDGLAMMETARIDLVITDILMPDADGIEVLREVRRDWPRIPVIAMSGGGQIAARDLLDMVGHLGADRVLQKPIHRADLLAAVQEVLGRPR